MWIAVLLGNGAKQCKIEEMTVEEILTLLKNSDLRMKYDAIVYGVNRFIDNDEIKTTLITLLEEENTISQNWWEDYEKTGGDIDYLNKKYKFSEEHGEYIIELIDKVIALNDNRAINVLVPRVHLGNKPFEAVIKYGRLAIDPLIKNYQETKDLTAKSSMIKALGVIVQESKFDSIVSDTSQVNIISLSQRKEIKQLLVNALKNNDPYVRIEATRALGNFGSKDVIPILQEINQNDKYKIIEGEKGEVYPVREAAAEAIVKIELKDVEKEE